MHIIDNKTYANTCCGDIHLFMNMEKGNILCVSHEDKRLQSNSVKINERYGIDFVDAGSQPIL